MPIFPLSQKRNDLKFEDFLNSTEDDLKFGLVSLCSGIGWLLCPAVFLTWTATLSAFSAHQPPKEVSD